MRTRHFDVRWRVTEAGGPEGTGDRLVASGRALKEAPDEQSLRDELMPMLRGAFPELTEFTTREYHVDIEEAE